jgi:hypothetical protein
MSGLGVNEGLRKGNGGIPAKGWDMRIVLQEVSRLRWPG